MTMEREPSVRPNVDLSLISSVTNPTEVAKLLSEVYHEERVVDGELRSLIDRQGSFEDLLNTAVQETEEVLEVVNADAEQLLSGITKACNVAESISSTVRSLDHIQTHVKAALSYIKVISDRSSCVHLLRDSMERMDHAAATECISQFYALQKEIGEEPEHHQKQAVEEIEKELLRLVRENLKAGIRNDDAPQIMHFMKLLIPLNHKAEALESYSTYLKSVISGQGRTEYQKLSDSLESHSKNADFVAHISNLFRSVAVLIEENQPVMKESFGEEVILDLLIDLQKECEEHTVRILERFVEEKKFANTVKEIHLRQNKQIGSISQQSLEPLDPRTVENALVDILNVVRRCLEFTTFMNGRIEFVMSNSKDLNSNRWISPNQTVLEFHVRELIGYYTTSEEFYLEESVKKAIEIDKMLSESLLSSMVDDVFFVFRKSASRAISSRNVPCSCSILSLMNTLLSQNYALALQQKLSLGPTSFVQSLLADKEDNNKEQSSDFGTFWNDIQMSISYTGKLSEELDQRIASNFTISKERETVSSILADLSKTGSDLEKISESAGQRLCEVLMTTLGPVVHEISTFNYQLDEQSYEQISEMETWPHQMAAQMEKYAQQTTHRLTTDNHAQLMDLLMSTLAQRCEVQVMQKKFNQLGGLQIDRDVRVLVTRFSEMSQSAVREKFSKLTQMGTILCFESVEEMLDYWGDEGGSINWKLSPGEIKSILRLRIDFNETNISSLLL